MQKRDVADRALMPVRFEVAEIPDVESVLP
jgi:hypothetical protein